MTARETRRTFTLALLLLFTLSSRIARADGTFLAGAMHTDRVRPAIGWAFSHCPQVAGFEIEYFSTHPGDENDRASAGSIIASVIVQPVAIGRAQIYGIGGFGLWGEKYANGGGTGEAGAKSIGGGVKIWLAEPLRLRIDYRSSCSAASKTRAVHQARCIHSASPSDCMSCFDPYFFNASHQFCSTTIGESPSFPSVRHRNRCPSPVTSQPATIEFPLNKTRGMPALTVSVKRRSTAIIVSVSSRKNSSLPSPRQSGKSPPSCEICHRPVPGASAGRRLATCRIRSRHTPTNGRQAKWTRC